MGRENILPAFTLGNTERVAMIGIGDSNQVQGGHGWDHGFQYAMSTLGYPMYGTGLASAQENGGIGAGVGYKWTKPGFVIGATTGAPASLDAYMNKGSGAIAPHNYLYLADGESFSNNNNGLAVDSDCPLDVNGNLTFEVHYGTFETGTGQMRIAIRRNNSPFTLLAQGSTVNPVTGAYGMTSTSVNLAAGSRPYQILGQIYNSATGVTLEGPSFQTFYRFINNDKTTGFSYHTLEYRGGQSARTMAVDCQQANDLYLTHFLEQVRAPLGASKAVIVCINSGLNDRNETLTSVGPGAISDGDSPAAFVDNIIAIIQRFTAIYDDNLWDTDQLYFLLMPSHQITDPDDAELISYRDAAEALSVFPGTAIVRMDEIFSYSQMLDFYVSVGDHQHLTQAGYETMALGMLRNLITG